MPFNRMPAAEEQKEAAKEFARQEVSRIIKEIEQNFGKIKKIQNGECEFETGVIPMHEDSAQRSLREAHLKDLRDAITKADGWMPEEYRVAE